jgi:hypothetical protein
LRASRILVARGFIVASCRTDFAASTGGIDDIDATFSLDDMFCFKLAVHFAHAKPPQAQFHQPRPKAPDGSGVRDIHQFGDRISEQQIAKRGQSQ